MLFKKLLRTLKFYKAQFISMILMTALGVGIFVGFNVEWKSIEDDTSYFYNLTGFADYRVISDDVSGYSAEDAENVAKIDGVSEVSRYVSVNAAVSGKDNKSVSLTVTENEKVSFFTVMKGENYDAESEEGVWLSDSFAEKNGISLSDGIAFSFKGITVSGVVKGLVKSSEYLICVPDETQLMPDFSQHGFAYVSPKLYENVTGGYYPQINVISSLPSDEFKSAVNETFGKRTLVLTKDEVVSFAEAQGEATEGKTMASVLPVVFLLIAILTMVTTMHRITAREKTQIGTLKALGFKDGKVAAHYTAFALFVGVIGTVLGVAIGYFLGWFIMNPSGSMGTYFDMPNWSLSMPWFCYPVLVGIVAFLTLVGFLSVKNVLKGTAAEVLRPYTPKRIKSHAFERTKMWRKRSFGFKWNARDLIRHKTRALMSLLGVVGCVVILVGAMGMKDTMDGYIKVFYDGAMNYASRVYLSENATDEDTDLLISRYHGDAGASVAVEVEGKTCSLEIYDINGDFIRFPNENNEYVKISDDGALISMRVAKKYGIKKGDEVSFAPYGSDKTYTVRAVGFVRSMTESVIISADYAESIGVLYKFGSIYTNVEKSEIQTAEQGNSAIKSIQSKADVMASFDSFMVVMNEMIVLLIVIGVLLAIVVLYNLGVMGYTERYREMATLKVVGFKNKRIGELLVGQTLFTTVVGIIIGLPLGIGVLDILIKALAAEYEMGLCVGVLTFSVSILVTLAVSLLVSLMVARKNKKIDMVEALKIAE